MTTVTLNGGPVRLAGQLPAVGSMAPDFALVRPDLTTVTKTDLAGRIVVLLTVSSLDTAACSTQTKKFNERVATVPGLTALVVSADLPFTIKRYCAAEGVDNIHVLSEVRDREFGRRWGVAVADGPFQGVLARAAFVMDPAGVVRYASLVPETSEPDYDAILRAACTEPPAARLPVEATRVTVT